MKPDDDDKGVLHALSQHRIAPPAVLGSDLAADLIDQAFLSYNAGRLREVCRVFTQKMLEPGCTVGLAISGALTPAGLGMSCLIPLIRAGFVDWIVSTGANLYHDTHYALDLPLHQSRPNLDDHFLRENDIIRIHRRRTSFIPAARFHDGSRHGSKMAAATTVVQWPSL